MVVTLLVVLVFVYHSIARIKTTDIGCRYLKAIVTQAVISYCAREFIKLSYNIRNAWVIYHNV